MKRIFLTTLTAGALASSAFAQTIITGEADYVGDFTSNGAAITGLDNNDPLFQTIETTGSTGGWVSWEKNSNAAWAIQSAEAVNTGSADGSRSNGLGIVFEETFSGNVTLSFDYVLGDQDNNGHGQGFLFVGISNTSTGGLTSNGFRYIPKTTPSTSLTGGATLLASAVSNEANNTQGTIGGSASGTFSTTVTLDSSTYDRYAFLFYGSPNSGSTTGAGASLDNVAVTIPEPSTALLLMGALGLGMITMRRRRA